MGYVAGPRAPVGCVFCSAPHAGDDRAHLVLHRSALGYLILNAYPYASGHLMAVVYRHIATLGEATAEERADLMSLAARATALLGAEYGAEGFNVGLNQGRVAGAGIADHLHVHIVPRWTGDSNFVAVVGDVRVLPEALDVTYDLPVRRPSRGLWPAHPRRRARRRHADDAAVPRRQAPVSRLSAAVSPG
jgi:ATP adenylyltransferase